LVFYGWLQFGRDMYCETKTFIHIVNELCKIHESKLQRRADLESTCSAIIDLIDNYRTTKPRGC
jgi:hypothetical protein